MKLRLTINGGSLAGREFDLETGFLTVGPSDNFNIRLDPLTERIASKQHAFIEARPDGYYITDNKSTNGTLVNGAAIDVAKLSDGDLIQFGRNGVTANVRIEMPTQGPQTDLTVDHFNAYQAAQFQQAAQNRPISIQNSLSQLGLGNLETAAPKPTPVGRYIVIAVTILVIVILSSIVGLIMFFSLGPIAAVIAAVVAFTPAMIYLLPFMWLDRYDPEPLWLLALAFAWGALVAVLVSIVINTVITIVAIVAASIAGLPPELGEL